MMMRDEGREVWIDEPEVNEWFNHKISLLCIVIFLILFRGPPGNPWEHG